MSNRKIQVGFIVSAIAVLLMSTSSVYAYKGLFSFLDKKKEEQTHDKPSPLYQGVIAPASDPKYKRRKSQEKKSNSNLETYSEFQKEQSKKDAEKKRLADQRKEAREKARLDKEAKRLRAQNQIRATSSSGQYDYMDPMLVGASSVEPISDEARELLSKRPVRIKGVSIEEYAIKNQIEALVKEAYNPKLSREDKVKATANAKSKLFNLANGLRVRAGVSDDAYRNINLPENIIKDKKESNIKALRLIRKEIERLDRR